MAQDSSMVVPVSQATPAAERPSYETPRIQVMTEREILNSFQITQSMANWWITTCC